MNKDILLTETADLLREKLKDIMDTLTVERAVIGLFFTGIKLSNGEGGLCFTPIKEIPKAVCCPSSARAMPLSGKLTNKSIDSYLEDLSSDNILKKTLAICVLNALSSTYWKMEKPTYELQLGKDTFDELTIPKKGKTVVVGALVPILKKLINADVDFTVLEMDSSTLKGEELKHYAPAEDAHLHIPEADLLVITGTTILNGSLIELLNMSKKGAEIIVTGPTASMIPDIFFKHNVTVMGGISVTDPDKTLDLISEAGSGYHFFGKSAERLIIENER